jgi:hypothetical protein
LKLGLQWRLRDLGIRGDIIKTMHRAVSAADPDVAGFALHVGFSAASHHVDDAATK